MPCSGWHRETAGRKTDTSPNSLRLHSSQKNRQQAKDDVKEPREAHLSSLEGRGRPPKGSDVNPRSGDQEELDKVGWQGL